MRTLLRQDIGHGKPAKLQLRFDTPKALGTGNKRCRQGQAHITRFYFLNDFIFVARVFQLHLVFKIEGSRGVVVEGKLHLLANLSQHIGVDIHIEIETALPALVFGKDGVAYVLKATAKGKVDISLGANVHSGAPKKPVEQLTSGIQAGVGSLSTQKALCCRALYPVVGDGLIHFRFHVLFETEVLWLPVIQTADLFIVNVLAGFRVVLEHRLNT